MVNLLRDVKLMYKIMIIDDEPIERMAISYVVKNSELPVMIVGEAADGLDAVKMCFDLNPDIVLLDIKMPCMDGLEAASEMLTLGLEGVIIFSTAYDEFEYAQKAIKLGAFDYILKPVRPEEVVKVIKRAIKELENRKRSQCRKMEEQKNLIKPYLESSLVFNLISGNFNLDELKKLAEFLEIDNFGQIALVIGVNSRNDNNDGYHNQLTRLQETKQKVLNIIKNEEKSIFGSVLMTSMGIDKVVVLVSVKEGNNDADIEHLVRDWANTIREKFLQADLGSITIGIGKSIKELDQIRESYLQAKKAFKIGSLLLEGNQLLHINDIESERYSPCCYEKETIVHGHIYNKEWEPLKRGFKEWFKDVVKSGEPIYIKKTRIIEMVIIISRAAIDEGAKREKVFDSLINFSNSMNLNHCLIDMLDYSVFVIEQFEHLVRECHNF